VGGLLRLFVLDFVVRIVTTGFGGVK